MLKSDLSYLLFQLFSILDFDTLGFKKGLSVFFIDSERSLQLKSEFLFGWTPRFVLFYLLSHLLLCKLIHGRKVCFHVLHKGSESFACSRHHGWELWVFRIHIIIIQI